MIPYSCSYAVWDGKEEKGNDERSIQYVQAANAAATWKTSAQRAGLFALFLICGLSVFAFGLSHLFATYVEPSSALVFGIITFTLGCAWALLMQKTNTLWGSVVFHLAADLYWFIAFGF